MDTKEIQAAVDGIKEQTIAALNKHKEEAKEEANKRYEDLKAAGVDTQELKAQHEKMLKRIDNFEAEWTRKATEVKMQVKSLGEIVTEDDGLKAFAKRWHKGGVVIPVSDGTFFPCELQSKTTITSSAVGSSTPGILVPDRLPGIITPGVRRLRVRDLVTRIPTESSAIEWLKENAFTNAASPVAETISKPESALTFTIDNIPIRTIAAWLPAAKQILADFKLLGAYINTRLMNGLMDVEDYELVAGDGTGQHISGMIPEATAYDTARNVTGDTKLDTLNHAISQMEGVLQEADGIIINPRDWRTIQLLKTNEGSVANNGAYLMGGPQGTISPVVWGLPVALTTAMTTGKFLVGSFKRHCYLFDRMSAQIDISTEHSDYFVRNMVAIRAEERIGFAVTRTDAIIYGTFPS